VISVFISSSAIASQSVYCHPNRSELSFGDQALTIGFSTRGNVDCTLHGDKFSENIRHSEPEIDIHFRGQKLVVNRNCVKDFQTDGGAVRVSFSESGATVLIYGQAMKTQEQRRLQIFIIEGELICPDLP